MTAAQTTVANGPTRPPVATASSWVSMASDRGTRNRLTPWARRTCRPRFGCRLCKSRLPATWDLVYDPSIRTDAARRSTTPPRCHSAAADDDLDAFAGPPSALSVLSEQSTVTERLLWSYTTCLSRFLPHSPAAHIYGPGETTKSQPSF